MCRLRYSPGVATSVVIFPDDPSTTSGGPPVRWIVEARDGDRRADRRVLAEFGSREEAEAWVEAAL